MARRRAGKTLLTFAEDCVPPALFRAASGKRGSAMRAGEERGVRKRLGLPAPSQG